MNKERPSALEVKDPAGAAKQFIKDNWPFIAGAATIAGAAVYLTAMYLKKYKSKKQGIPANQLDQISQEAIQQKSELHALLEEGDGLSQIAGHQITSQAAQELAQSADDPDLAEALETLSQTSRIT